MPEQFKNWNWPLIAFGIQVAGIVWVSAVAFTKLDNLIAKVDKMEFREYPKEIAMKDWENQRLHNVMVETRIRNLEDFKKWKTER